MIFNINEIYGAIPCTVKYTVLDASLNPIVTRTIINPPTPPSFPICFIVMPAFVEIEACGCKFRVPVNTGGCCQDVQLFCNCLTTPSWYTFHVCLIPTPGGPCAYTLDIQV